MIFLRNFFLIWALLLVRERVWIEEVVAEMIELNRFETSEQRNRNFKSEILELTSSFEKIITRRSFGSF